jgi:hypothetical protein
MPVFINTAIGTVQLIELFDDYKKGIDIQRGPYVECSFLAPLWSDTNAVINALMGSTTASSSGPSIHIPGFPCPTSPNLTCMDAYVVGEAEFDAQDGGHPTYNLAKIRATFGIRSWEQLANDDPQGAQSFPSTTGPTTYAIHSMDFGTESVKIPGSAYKFFDGGLPFDTPGVIHIGTATLNIEMKKVPYLPTITILKLIGNCNNDLFMGAPKGTLLFLGARTSKEFESDGTRVQNVSYSFKYRAQPWNFFIRPDTGKWDFIIASDGSHPYPLKDLTPLILLQGFAGQGSLPGGEP